MQTLVIDLRITPEEFQRLYAGEARAVVAYARDGRRVRFPAKILVPFVTRQGIAGSYEISFDNHNKFQGIRRLPL